MIYAIFETNGEPVLLKADEISDDDIQSIGVNCKTTVSLYIFPTFEAWRKIQRTVTLVRIIDTDKDGDRMIFKGRVLTVSDNMDNAGRIWQEITCFSSLDFLEDTVHTGYLGYGWIPPTALDTWLAAECLAHNTAVDDAREIVCTITGDARVWSHGETLYKTRWKTISDVLTGGKYLEKIITEGGETTYQPNYVMEFRERWERDISYIDVAERFGETKSTPIKIGENLKDIRVERNTDGGIYTSVLAVSGVNADGYRDTVTAVNAEMQALYGTGRVCVIVNDDIRFTGKGGRYYDYALGRWEYHVTDATRAMEAALTTWAEQEAAKLSDPPVKITINAVDLARMGYADSDPFEVGNSHPVVAPQIGLFGEPMRITALRRRLASGQIASITIEKGQKLGGRTSDTLSKQMAQLDDLNRRTEDAQSKQVEIAQTKVDTQTDDFVFKEMTPTEYENLPSTSKFKTHGFCIVRNPLTNETKLYINGENINSGGGGEDRGTIENAVVLTSEQNTEWAPEHDLTPVWFRGTASVYYGQSPARFVAQGQRVLHGVDDANIVADDIISEFDLELSTGAIKRYRLVITAIEYYSDITRFYPYCYVYDVTGGSETYEGRYGNYRGYGVIDVPVANTTWKIGVVLWCSSWGTINGMLSPNLSMRIYGWGDVSGVLSNQYLKSFSPPYNPVPVSQAESDFGVTITTKTEPVAPT